MKWFKDFCSIVVEEVCLQSSYGKALGTDTFKRWVGTIAIFLIFSWVAHHFDGWFMLLDNWLNHQFGWERSTPPSSGKIALHRTAAAVLSGITILAATIEYLIWIRRRMLARREASLKAISQM